MLRASHAEHEDRDWRAVIIGSSPLKAGAAGGTLIRVPDTPANRALFGSTGTGDGSSPYPQLRALPLNDASTRALLGMPHGPAGTDKAAAEQALLDVALEQYPHLFTKDRIWLLDRNYPGAARIARLAARTHVLARLKSDVPLKQISPILPDGSCPSNRPSPGTTRQPSACPKSEKLPTVTKPRKLASTPKCLKPLALGCDQYISSRRCAACSRVSITVSS